MTDPEFPIKPPPERSGPAPEPETIGELTYLPHPDYPYPFPVPQPPHYWMTEQSGKLAAALEPYLNGERVDRAQLALIQQYLTQYLERAVLMAGTQRELLLRRIAKLRTTADLERFSDELAEYGVEPF